MTSDLDIYRSANELIKQHGDAADIEAAMRADERLAAGDMEGETSSTEARTMRTPITVIRNALIALALVATLAVVLQAGKAEAKRIVLNCDIEEGLAQLDSTQIMIDEDKGIVIYHFQYLKGPGPLQKFRIEGPLPEGVTSRDMLIDQSMKITINTKNMIQANDASHVFIITKHDGRFVYAFVTPIPTKDGNWFAFSNTLRGTCTKSPFD